MAIERYGALPEIPGARSNGRAWELYFRNALGLSSERVLFLRDQYARKADVRAKLREAAALARPGARVWVVFIGHGAISPDGKDGLLVTWEATGTNDSLAPDGDVLAQSEVLSILGEGAQDDSVLLLDTCFSGKAGVRDPGGGGEVRVGETQLVPGNQPTITDKIAASLDGGGRATILAAGARTQFAGPLPGLNVPAFSYLALGALRGWADVDGDGAVSASEVISFSNGFLARTLDDRQQNPELISGAEGAQAVLSSGGDERGPDPDRLRANGQFTSAAARADAEAVRERKLWVTGASLLGVGVPSIAIGGTLVFVAWSAGDGGATYLNDASEVNVSTAEDDLKSRLRLHRLEVSGWTVAAAGAAMTIAGGVLMQRFRGGNPRARRDLSAQLGFDGERVGLVVKGKF